MRKYYWDRLGMSHHDDNDKCHTLDGASCEQDYVLYTDVQSLQAERDMLRETLAGLLRAYEQPNRQLCCDGRECGCMGSTAYQEAEHYARRALEETKA